jgi:hypothetical protein
MSLREREGGRERARENKSEKVKGKGKERENKSVGNYISKPPGPK